MQKILKLTVNFQDPNVAYEYFHYYTCDHKRDLIFDRNSPLHFVDLMKPSFEYRAKKPIKGFLVLLAGGLAAFCFKC